MGRRRLLPAGPVALAVWSAKPERPYAPGHHPPGTHERHPDQLRAMRNPKLMRHRASPSWLHQILVFVLVESQLLVGVPLLAAPADPARSGEPEAAAGSAAPAEPAGAADPAPEAPPVASAKPKPAPPVKVNRTVPKVEPIPQDPVFGAEPKRAEITRARVFGEPLVAVGDTPTVEDNKALAQAIKGFHGNRKEGRPRAIDGYLQDRPDSPWRASLQGNLGRLYRRNGYFTRSEKALRESWDLAKGSEDPKERLVADAAVGELLNLYRSFGRLEPLEELLGEVEDRPMLGDPAERRLDAGRPAWILRNRHEMAIPSGPLALDRILHYYEPMAQVPAPIEEFHATEAGATLAEMAQLAQEVGMRLQMGLRHGGEIPLPAMMHLKVGHFSAILRQEGDRFLLDDPLLGGEVWMNAEALEEESSGYFLIPEGKRPAGWTDVDEKAATTIRGFCAPAANPRATGMCNKRMGGSGGCTTSPCMATYSFHAAMGSLHLQDAPVGYSPPRGPS